jgi:hypothetical protein
MESLYDKRTVMKMKDENPVNKANEKKAEENDFPGYPHYDEKEDITRQATEKVPLDVENISRLVDVNTTINENRIQPDATAGEPTTAVIPPDPDGEVELVPGTEADVTEEDLMALGSRGLSMDGGDDEVLRTKTYPIQSGDEDLDIPGAELDDLNEQIGSEDEENNYYSLGGDNHENLEEDRSSLD